MYILMHRDIPVAEADGACRGIGGIFDGAHYPAGAGLDEPAPLRA